MQENINEMSINNLHLFFKWLLLYIMASSEIKEHWEKIYSTKKPNEVSWFQVYPKISIEFTQFFKLPKDAAIVDIGGGDSNFVDALIELGYYDITVLDISFNAIARAKERLGNKADTVKWIVSDITQFEPEREYRFWHDRAVFHFLTSHELVEKYVEIAKKGIAENGYLILGTFSEKGPDKCSGLEVKKYSRESMSGKFKDGFKRVKCVEEEHLTPFHTTQSFLFCSFQSLKKN